MASDFQTTTEIVRRAHGLLAPPIWDYIVGGSETETTIRRNREAISAFAFRPRILRNVSKLDTSTTVLGTKLRIPYILAPVGSLQEAVEAGAAASVRAAIAFGTLSTVSSVSQPGLEPAAAAATGDKWFQLYIRGDFEWVSEIVGRVRAAGYNALILTVDTAHYSRRERQLISGWVPPARRRDLEEQYQGMLDWETVRRIKEIAGIPIGIKGIQTGEDAEIALQEGIDLIWVSNHGGRQLDHARATIDVLPEVAAVVAGKVPIVVDGGFMRGTDVLKAIALGASAVATGRLHALALAAGGEAGAVRMLEILEIEVRTSMALLGVTSLGQIDRSYLASVTPLSNPPAAFPFLSPDILL
jgi:isopentenyl diphosphate isomerase/L-lactate dehydrogenase-like FMN-dependent dehydrogenase